MTTTPRLALPLALSGLLAACAAVPSGEIFSMFEQHCANDAGVQVYQIVELPAAHFNERSYPKFSGHPLRLVDGDETYVFRISSAVIYQAGKARIQRTDDSVIRLSDKKILARSINYSVANHYTGFPAQGKSCPQLKSPLGQVPLIQSVFKKS